MSVESDSEVRSSRGVLLLEAVFPIAALQAYIWSVPHARPRWLDVAFAGAIAAVVGWYVIRRGDVTWRTFGLARGPEHLRAILPFGLFTLGAVSVLLVGGWLTDGQPSGGLRQDWDLLGALCGYPVWGLIQQGLLLGVAYPRLRRVAGPRGAAGLVALLFAGAHAPNPLLMGGGAAMALAYALTWEHWPSLPLVALSHGIIGAVCDKALHVSMRVGRHYFEP